MAAPTTYTTLNIQDIVDEAFRRCRVDLETLGAVHNRDARKTLVFILSAWASRMSLPFQIEQGSVAVTSGVAYVAAPSDWIAPVTVTYRTSEGIDFPLGELLPGQYQSITDKDSGGQPNSFYYDQNLRRIYLWPVPTQTGETLSYSAFARTPDAYTGTSDHGLPFEVIDAITAELAWRLGQKLTDVPADWVAYLGQISMDSMRAVRTTGAGGTMRIVPAC